MQLRWHYAQGKFSEALGLMASHSGNLRDRLSRAYLKSLIHIHEHDLPPELHDRLKSIHDSVVIHSPVIEGESAVEATIRKLHPSRIKSLINEIADIEYELAQVYID